MFPASWRGADWRRRGVLTWLVLVIGLAISAPLFAAVTADVDRYQLYSHETLTLTVVVSGDDKGEPDFRPVEQAFDIVGQSQSNSFSYINGRMESRSSWFVTLAPKREGTSRIPAISVGQRQTQPIDIEVLPASASVDPGQAQEIFLDVEVTPETAYVQSQIAYTVRIFYATELTGGRLSDLSLDNAIVERLGEDRGYQRLRDGKRYNVIERRYAIFPQSSGTLHLPPTVFDGSVALPTQRRSRDPFLDPFGVRGSSKKVRLKSDAHSVEVKPRPAAFNGQWWLPARELKLTEAWSEQPPVFRVGEPVTRTVTLQATGLTAAQLPPLALPDLAGIKAYPDQPVSQNGGDGGWIIGARQDKIALVPAQPGEMTLPAVEVRWWDTAQDRERVTRLPERVINVLPAETAAVPPPSPVTLADTVAESVPPVDSAPKVAAGAGFWSVLAVFFGCAWLVTLLLLFHQRRSHSGSADDRRDARGQAMQRLAVSARAVKQACDRNDARAARDALLSWAKASALEGSVNSLGELAGRIEDESAKTELQALDKALYSGRPGEWVGGACWRAISPVLKQHGKGKRRDGQGDLPALYPT